MIVSIETIVSLGLHGLSNYLEYCRCPLQSECLLILLDFQVLHVLYITYYNSPTARPACTLGQGLLGQYLAKKYFSSTPAFAFATALYWPLPIV